MTRTPQIKQEAIARMQSHIEPDISQPQAKSEPTCVKDHMWESVGVGAPFTLDCTVA
jgi:hypothetical protein